MGVIAFLTNIEYDENDMPIGIPTIKTMRDKLATYGFHDLDFDTWNEINSLIFIKDFKPSLHRGDEGLSLIEVVLQREVNLQS